MLKKKSKGIRIFCKPSLDYGAVVKSATGRHKGKGQREKAETVLSSDTLPTSKHRTSYIEQSLSDTIMSSSRESSSLSQDNEDNNEMPSPIVSSTSDYPSENDISNPRSRSFFHFFIGSKGPPQIVFLCMLYAMAYGCIVGVVPSVMTNQYATRFHSFDDGNCADYTIRNKPQACIDGNNDAQTSAAMASFVSNTLTFITSSLVGSITDEYGRRNALILAQFFTCLSPFCLVLIQTLPLMNPDWYYMAQASTGLVSWISVALAALSDVMPRQWRAPTFGILFAFFSLGFALSPIFALGLTHYGVSILSSSLLFSGLFYSIFFLPETLPKEAAELARSERREYHRNNHETVVQFLKAQTARPFKELSILNRNYIFRLISALAFFSGMSSSADQTLLVYYVENELSFSDADVALMFGIIGIAGIIVQGAVLKPFTELAGERFVIVTSFIFGAITNILYAFATSKQLIFVAVVVSSVGAMSFPTISAIKANNAEEFEQGRIQGALYALSSLSSAIGPCVFRLVYQITKDTKYPGSFFLTATVCFIVATFCGLALPKEKANSHPIDPLDEESHVQEQEIPLI